MATSITLSGPVAYSGGSSTSSKFVGYNASQNCVLRYSFTTPSGGYITSLNLSAQFAWLSAQGYSSSDGSKQSVPTRVKITTSSTSHVNAGSSTTDYDAELPTFVNFSAGANVQNSISTTVSGIRLSPSTTYYMYFFPSSSRHHMFYFYDYTGTDNTAISYDSLVVQYTLTLNKDSGVSSFTGAGTYDAGSSVSTTVTAKTGYHLTKYVGTKADGSGTGTWTKISGLTTHTEKWGLNCNRTITAYSEANSYTNTIAHWLFGFNGEGNNDGGTAYNIANTTFTKTYGATVTYTANDATTVPNGCYVQDYVGSNSYAGTWTSYNFGVSFTQPAKSTGVQYNYQPYTYSITYNLNGGTNSSSNPSTYNVLYGVTFSNPTKEGYNFLGWYINGAKVTGINPGANATFSSASDLYSQLSSRTTGNVTVEAKWAAQGLVYIDNGSSWDAYQIFIDNGSSWDQYVPYIDNGSSWDLYS